MSFYKQLPALCASSLIAGSLSIGLANAAPQILAVAATTTSIPMQCTGGNCVVELSSICLQEFRASPMAGTEYYIANQKSLEVTAITEDGRNVRLPANLEMKITTVRGHNAVKVSLPSKTVRTYGVERFAIAVPPGIALVPVAIKGDKNPQTDLDIELASGPFRKIAAHIVDSDKAKRGTAELINLTINRLDVSGRSSVDTRKNALAQLRRDGASSGFSKTSVGRAEKLTRKCFSETKVGFQSFRQCLGSSHDQLIGKLNTKYWNHLKSGS